MNRYLNKFLEEYKLRLITFGVSYLIATALCVKYNIKYPFMTSLSLPIIIEVIRRSVHNDKVREYREEIFHCFGGKYGEKKLEDGRIERFVSKESSIHLLQIKFKDDYNFGATLRIISGTFDDISKKLLETAFNRSIVEMELIPRSKNTFYVECADVKETKYSKYEKGSISALAGKQADNREKSG